MNRPSKGIALWNRAKKIIPGGNQFLSKRSEMYLPDQWPSYYTKAQGVQIWDLDGNCYIDMSNMGVGSCILGYADPDVNARIKDVIDTASATTLNAPEEIELAELLTSLHPWAHMVRYARTGGEAMAIAIRIARAYTRKDRIAFCGYHGWSDWYLAANLADDKNLDGHLLPGLNPLGVPRALKGTAVPFAYNHLEELEKLVERYDDIGVIVMEPLRHEKPEHDFLNKVKSIAKKIGAVLIFDEVTSAWRLNVGGVHMTLGVEPDIAVFGKAMSNGYPMAAIIGRDEIMKVAQDTFISSTNWSERIGPVAALACINKFKDKDVPAHLERIGQKVHDGLEACARAEQLDITVSGPDAMVSFAFNYGSDNLILRTLFAQEMLRRGFLTSTGMYMSYAHTEPIVHDYLAAVSEVFALIKKGLVNKNIHSLLQGPIAHSGFKRLTS